MPCNEYMSSPYYAHLSFPSLIDRHVLFFQADEVDFEDVFEYDNTCFIGKNNPVRKAFLQKWINLPGGAAVVARNRDGHVTGLGCRRPCMDETFHMIGPLYADDRETAEVLFQELCRGIAGQQFYINTW